MTITITFSEPTERTLRVKAAERGQEVGEFVRELVERQVGGASSNGPVVVEGRMRPTFEELTAPIADAVRSTGMSDDEIGDFFEEVVREVRAERRAVPKPAP